MLPFKRPKYTEIYEFETKISLTAYTAAHQLLRGNQTKSCIPQTIQPVTYSTYLIKTILNCSISGKPLKKSSRTEQWKLFREKHNHHHHQYHHYRTD